MNDFTAESEELVQSLLSATRRVISSGWYILGPEVENFEKLWANQCNVKHAVGLANGMDAIEVMLRAAGVQPGDEIITTPMTAFATVLAVIRAGAIPVLADIDPDTGLMSIESATRCISTKTTGILLVHLYGQISDMDKWLDFCQSHNLLLFEDCAQAHLAKHKGKCSGSFGVAGAHSFYPTKNLGALGDAGAIVTSNDEIFDKSKILRNYGQSERYHHPVIGINSRLDEIQAAFLAEKIIWLDRYTEIRKKIAKAYRLNIKNPLIHMMKPPVSDESHVYHLFVVKTEYRSQLQSHMLQCGVQTLIHYPLPIHYQPPCTDIRRDPYGLSSAEHHSSLCLSVPCHPHMSDSDVERVVASLNSFRVI
jgi:dTDP-4-amino-4,6-dideoxygalactose transaminase